MNNWANIHVSIIGICLEQWLRVHFVHQLSKNEYSKALFAMTCARAPQVLQHALSEMINYPSRTGEFPAP